MLESQLKILIRTVLLAGLTARGMPDVLVKSKYQPRQEGVPNPATVFVFLYGPVRRVGSPKREFIYNSVSGALDYVTTQLYESTYQISGLVAQSPATPEAMTAADLVETASDILQHEDAQIAFTAESVGILRVKDISVLWFETDKGQNEANPSFEIIMSRSISYTRAGNAITYFETNIQRV